MIWTRTTLWTFHRAPEPEWFGDTITVTWMENSSPAAFAPTWSDWAEWAEAWSEMFDKWFDYSWVLLNANWGEVAEVTQDESGWAWQLDLSQLGTLSWTSNNVMIKFPVRWVKMTKNGSTVTLSMTKELNKPWYQYYAFNRNGTIMGQMYLWAFKWSFTTDNSTVSAYSAWNSYLKSWATGAYTSWQSPAVSQTISTFKTTAEKNWTNYHQIWWFQRMYVNCMYMMKYGNPDSQTVIGRWFVDWNSAAVAPGGLLSNTSAWTNASWGETTGKVQSRLFWLEDWWWNIYEWVDGIYSDAGRYIFVNTDNANIVNSSNITTTASSPVAWTTTGVNSSYVYSWVTFSSNVYWNITSIIWNNWWGFVPSSMSWSDYTIWYCDSGRDYASCFAYAGGNWDNASNAGAFRLGVNYSATNTYAYIGARLAYV